MKKHRLFVSALLILALLLPACRNGTDGGSESGTYPPPEGETPDRICIAEGGKSDFMIFCDVTDLTAKEFAQRLQSHLINTYGVQIALRDVDSMGDSPNRILVGDVGDPDMNDWLAQAGEQDLAIRTSGQEICLYATGEEQYLLLDVLLRSLYLQPEGEFLYMNDQIDYLYSRDHIEGQRYGASASFATDGSVSYTLVYSEQENEGGVAAAFARKLGELTGIDVSAGPDSGSYQNEILFGSCSRSEIRSIAEMEKAGDWLVGISSSGKAVINGYEKIDRLRALYTFASMLNANNGTLYESDTILSSFGEGRYPLEIADVNAFYRSTYGTFATYVERQMAEMSETDKRDQELVELLIERLEGGFAIGIGSSSALYDGNLVKLDSQDYSKKTYLSADGEVMAAAEFLNGFFDAELPTDADGFVNLTDVIAARSDYTLCFKENYGVAIVLAAGAESFERDNTGVNGYRNREYVARMAAFLNNPMRPEPENNTEQSRVVIEEAPYDPDSIYDYTIQGHLTYYSPGICVTEENGGEVIYVTYESCMAIQMGTEYDNITYLKRSTDGGESWTLLGSVPGMRWGTVFELNGVIYVIGTALTGGNAMVARYTPDAGIFESKKLEISLGNGAPCAVVVANGRVWRATECVTSAPVDADLFQASSWTVSSNANDVLSMEEFISMSGTTVGNAIRDYGNFHIGEGNVVVSPEGKIYAMFRVNAAPQCDYAVILEVSEDGRTLRKLEGNGSVVRFPSTQSKFSVRYDEKTQCYISITNISPTSNTTFWSCRARNVAALVVSKDLVNWTVVDVLFVDRAMVTDAVSRFSHAYQYVDFDFSGDDLRLIVREATGETYHYHDGKYITMYTLENYAELIQKHI